MPRLGLAAEEPDTLTGQAVQVFLKGARRERDMDGEQKSLERGETSSSREREDFSFTANGKGVTINIPREMLHSIRYRRRVATDMRRPWAEPLGLGLEKQVVNPGAWDKVKDKFSPLALKVLDFEVQTYFAELPAAEKRAKIQPKHIKKDIDRAIYNLEKTSELLSKHKMRLTPVPVLGECLDLLEIDLKLNDVKRQIRALESDNKNFSAIDRLKHQFIVGVYQIFYTDEKSLDTKKFEDRAILKNSCIAFGIYPPRSVKNGKKEKTFPDQGVLRNKTIIKEVHMHPHFLLELLNHEQVRQEMDQEFRMQRRKRLIESGHLPVEYSIELANAVATMVTAANFSRYSNVPENVISQEKSRIVDKLIKQSRRPREGK